MKRILEDSPALIHEAGLMGESCILKETPHWKKNWLIEKSRDPPSPIILA
jgi:hypothetical protein